MSIIQLNSMNETPIGREDDLREPDFEDRRFPPASRLCIRAGRDSGSDSTCRATGAPGTAGGRSRRENASGSARDELEVLVVMDSRQRILPNPGAKKRGWRQRMVEESLIYRNNND
ncbi:hypothetical protein CDV36_008194 [Fusarium kuroshium]|uniref:Uncharacterized protein n=1 Tax=Fusarium kuroshium TaxID=2010991 RepID=A0A3M2S3Q5_9HYPO|nr:hypothetical protein CDV36_008194 [Fusarium kuroshium]